MSLNIGGLIKQSFVDYPGHLAAVIFTRGCNFRCPYCHNPELVLPNNNTKATEHWSESEVLTFLEKRRHLLDGVVLCGGEPTLQKNLIPFLRKLKTRHFKTKLDTNGSHPEVIKQALEEGLIDFIAMDVKAPLKSYADSAGVNVPEKELKESIQIIKTSGLPYEFRTTAVKPLHTLEHLIEIGQWVSERGTFVLQQFINGSLLSPEFSEKALPFTPQELESVKRSLNAQGIPCLIR